MGLGLHIAKNYMKKQRVSARECEMRNLQYYDVAVTNPSPNFAKSCRKVKNNWNIRSDIKGAFKE